MRPQHSICALLFACASCASLAQTAPAASAPAPAATLAERQAQALNEISKYARENCEAPATRGSSSSLELSGNAKLGLSKLVKKIGDLGIEGAGKYESKESEGILQKDLAVAMKDTRNCKMKVMEMLVDRMVPSVKP